MSSIFNGSNSYLSGGNALGFERTQTAAWSLWYKAAATNPATAHFLATKRLYSSTFRGWGLLVRGDLSGDPFALTLCSTVTTSQLTVEFPRANDTAWHHVAVSYNGSSGPSGVAAWVDGASQSLTTVTNTLSATITQTNPFNLGSVNDTTTNLLPGRLADVGMWIDLDVAGFAAAVPLLAAGIRPTHATGIRNELVFYQPLIAAPNESPSVGPSLTAVGGMTYDVGDHPPIIVPPYPYVV